MPITFYYVNTEGTYETIEADDMRDVAAHDIVWNFYNKAPADRKDYIRHSLRQGAYGSGTIFIETGNPYAPPAPASALPKTATWATGAPPPAPKVAKPRAKPAKVATNYTCLLKGQHCAASRSRTAPRVPAITGSRPSEFIGWLRDMDAMASTNNSVYFRLGDAKWLYPASRYDDAKGDKNATIEVPVWIEKSGRFMRDTKFYFHYHPNLRSSDISGAGSGYASKAHIKVSPNAKWRVTEPELRGNDILIKMMTMATAECKRL